MPERSSTLESEWDLALTKQIYYGAIARTVIRNLQKRKMNGYYASGATEALEMMLREIPDGAVVARGDSLSVDKVGVIEALEARGNNKLIDPMKKNEDGTPFYSKEECERLDGESFQADIFLTGTNAITLDGVLLCCDGMGNRVSPMIFGPRKVFVVCGMNKIAKDTQEGLQRIRQVAAPLNAIRHFEKHRRLHLGDLPCVTTGRCTDCRHDARICSYTVMIEGNDLSVKGRTNVFLVGEELGL